MGRSHFSFGGERKVCKRKPAARRLREKGFYCPFWRRGSLCRAQRSWPDYACHRARSELAFFRRQNGRAFFPPLPIAALLPRSWRWAYLPPCGDSASVTVGVEQSYPLQGKRCFVAWLLCHSNEKGFCSGSVGVGQAYPLQGFCFRHSGCGAVLPLAGEWDSDAWPILEGHRPAGLGVRAMRPVAEWRSALATRQGAAPDPRAARPVA